MGKIVKLILMMVKILKEAHQTWNNSSQQKMWGDKLWFQRKRDLLQCKSDGYSKKTQFLLQACLRMTRTGVFINGPPFSQIGHHINLCWLKILSDLSWTYANICDNKYLTSYKIFLKSQKRYLSNDTSFLQQTVYVKSWQVVMLYP